MRLRSGRLTALVGSAVTALALVLTACGSNAPAASSGRASRVVLVGGIQTEPNWWFAYTDLQTCSTSNFGIGLLYHGLLYISPQDTINYGRSIASGITTSHNDTVFTIHLKSNWKWSNGTPVTASDVLFSWDILKNTSYPTAVWQNCGAGVGGIPNEWRSVTAPNPHTVVITTTQPVNPLWFEINGIAQLSPIPKAVWDRYPNNMTQELKWIQSVANEPFSKWFQVTDGPYKLTKLVNDEYWVFTANPNYSGHKPQIQTLQFNYETGDSGVYLGLRKGVLSQADLPPEYASSKAVLEKNYDVVQQGYSFGINYIQLNESSQAPGGIGSAFAQLDVRKALQMGIDQAQIVSKIYNGYAHVEYGPIPPEPPNAYYSASSVYKWPFNTRAGLKLLEKDGWTMGPGNVLEKNGQKLAFTLIYMSGTVTDDNLVQLLKADWAKEGIQVTLKPLPFNQVVGLISQPTQYQALWWGAGWYYGPDFYPTGGELYHTGGLYTPPGYSNAKTDQLIDATKGPGTPAQEQQRMAAYQAWVSRQLPVLWLPEYIGVGTPSAYQAIAPYLQGVVKYYNPIGGASYHYWTIKGT
ncbi:MAG: peptide ABC transporter substrate-binding protein [Clostridia bacterium]